jgi:hypothetical protein
LALAVLLSCASGTQSTSPSGSRDVLTAKDLAESGDPNLLLALERLRPNWVRPRGVVSLSGPSPVVAYVNGLRVGGVEYLVDITINEVELVRFVSASDAATRYGLNVVSGVIEVTTRPGRP